MLKAAALGFRVHSGWTAMVALAEPVSAPCIVRRLRIELANHSVQGSLQPYHAAEQMSFPDAERHLEKCSAATSLLARKAVQDLLAELTDYGVKGACVLLASGRPLPGLAAVLASHALIHTAEGEFFRKAVREACEYCGLPEVGIPERDLHANAARALGFSVDDLSSRLVLFGKAIGPPWRQDEKLSAMAAWVALARS